MKRILAIFVCLLFIGTMFIAAAVVAPKPPKPPKPPDDPIPPGNIYYCYPDNDVYWEWTMKADGTSRTKNHLYISGIMSHLEHDGHYWYIRFETISGSTYPDGQARQEIFAVRDDNSKSVQLTNDATLATNYLSCIPNWGPDDEFISWSAYRWYTDSNGEPYVDDGGIYKASVSFDANGDITGLGTINLVYETGTWSTGSGSNAEYYCIAREHLDWSPDGNKVVYTVLGGSLNVYDTVATEETTLTTGWVARWSPDGNYIAYKQNDNLEIIKSDGTGETTVVQAPDDNAYDNEVRNAEWSPDSNYLTYTYCQRFIKRVRPWKTSLYVVELDGTNNNCISSGMGETDWKMIIAWK